MRDDDITISWNSHEGKKRLFESRYNGDFFRLSHLFQPQINPVYCAVATAVIVLNALRIKTGLRIDSGFNKYIQISSDHKDMQYNTYSQLTLLDEDTDAIRKKSTIYEAKDDISKQDNNKNILESGMKLHELANLLKVYLLQVDIISATRSTAQPCKQITRFRHNLMAYMNDSNSFIITNYNGKVLGKNVGGHFSPIAAYHEESDSCLVMDVAGHKHPWFWVAITDLYNAMATLDNDQPRGYLIVSDKIRHRTRVK